MPVVTPIEMGPSMFKNLQGELLKRMGPGYDFGKCMDECKKEPSCSGINFCKGLVPLAADPVCGGNVRVGLEDSLWIGAGRLAESNAQQVRAIRKVIEVVSPVRDVASR